MRWADDGAEGPIERMPGDAGNDFDIRCLDWCLPDYVRESKSGDGEVEPMMGVMWKLAKFSYLRHARRARWYVAWPQGFLGSSHVWNSEKGSMSWMRSLQASCEEDCASAQGRSQHIFSYCDGYDSIWLIFLDLRIWDPADVTLKDRGFCLVQANAPLPLIQTAFEEAESLWEEGAMAAAL